MPQYVSLGFVLVTPHLSQGWEDISVPPKFYTPSACLSDLYPDSDLLGWNEQKEAELPAQYQKLGLLPTEGEALTEQLQHLFEARRWGLDSVFVDLADAQAVARRWLAQVPDLKLLGMALPGSWLPKFCAVFETEHGGYQGRYLAARAARTLQGGKSLGFEVLGVEGWSEAHTSACSDIRLKFRSGFNAEFNQYGFLTTEEQAEVAAREYMFEEDGVGIENSDWFPVQIFEWLLVQP